LGLPRHEPVHDHSDATGREEGKGLERFIRAGVESAFVDATCKQQPTRDRQCPDDAREECVVPGAMAEMDQYIDLMVPRGGRALIETVVSYARMPVIKHYVGVCIAYVDREADLDMAVRIVVNAKTQRPGVCNAIETVLVHREIAAPFFKKIAPILAEKKVEMRADPDSFHQLSALSYQPLRPARDEDWTTEYLDLILAARTVDNIENAIAHVEKCGSHHSDVIITRDVARAEKFLNEVDSATVYWNASTRFTDGAEFGFGAEIGISTDKLHARGPMALEELMTYKYVIRGQGQIRE